MINQEIRLEGRKLFEERLEFGKKYIVYPSIHEAVAHSSMDGHTHLIRTTSTSPRFFFTATQGTSGKTAATQLSYFFVQNPIIVTEAGAGLVKKLREEPLPTILYDESQDAFGPAGNSVIRALLNSYVSGIPRTITGPDGEPIDLDLFCPVIMNGLTTKYDIPANFLERCIQTKLRKKLITEDVEDFEFADLRDEIGDSLRIPRVEWSKGITKADIQDIRPRIRNHLKSIGISSRDGQLWRPLVEYSYLCGDDIYERVLQSAKYYLDKPEIKLTTREVLLRDILEICLDTKKHFLYSSELLSCLLDMSDSPWPSYKGKSLNEHNIAWLLSEYSIRPAKDDTGSRRGYYMKSFVDDWQRVLGQPEPEHLRAY